MDQSHLVLWSIPDCESCAALRKGLAARGLSYLEEDATSILNQTADLSDLRVTELIQAMLLGDLSFPILQVGEAPGAEYRLSSDFWEFCS